MRGREKRTVNDPEESRDRQSRKKTQKRAFNILKQKPNHSTQKLKTHVKY